MSVRWRIKRAGINRDNALQLASAESGTLPPCTRW